MKTIIKINNMKATLLLLKQSFVVALVGFCWLICASGLDKIILNSMRPHSASEGFIILLIVFVVFYCRFLEFSTVVFACRNPEGGRKDKANVERLGKERGKRVMQSSRQGNRQCPESCQSTTCLKSSSQLCST